MKWLRDECEILDVVSEKVAKSNKLAQIGRWLHVTKQLKFFTAGSDASWRENKSKIGHFGVAKEAFSQVDLELMLLELGQNLVEHLQVMLVSGCMNDDVVDVDDDVTNAVKDFFHESLERGWTAQESHGRGHPFKLAMALDGEGGEVTVFVVNGHLPETGSEVDGGKNSGIGSADITDALVDLLHGVFAQKLQILRLELVRNIEVGSVLYLLIGE